MINKRTAYIIFQLLWIYFLISNIADFRLNRNIDLIPFINVSEIPLIKFVPFIIIGAFLIPYRKFLDVFKDKNNLKAFSFIILLLSAGYLSSFLSSYPQTALGVCNRITYYFAVLIFALAAAGYFENAKNFLIKSFVYVNILVIAGSLLDFYVPQFHDLLVSHFDRPAAFHSEVNIRGMKIMRPMGFLTDSNLTAFSLAIALTLLLLNYTQFSKIFRYSFYALSSFSLGMLASRASLLIIIISAAVFFFSRITGRKEIYVFAFAFVIFQAVTPQTYYRFHTLFDKKQNRMEFSTGRFLLWETALTVFKENPVIGAGPGVFFELSDSYIRKSMIERYDFNLDKPNEPDYFKIDKKNPHNIFLVLLSETGITGFVIFLGLILFLSLLYVREKKFISLLFLINILIVSSVSNFAPYYKFYLVMCIVFFITAKQNMKILSGEEATFTNIKKILIFKLCCLGDTVSIVPAIKSLKENFAGAKIIYAHSHWVSSMIEYIPGIDGNILFEHVYSQNVFRKISGALKFILKARKENFDLALFGHRSSQLSFILLLCGIRYRLGFSGTKFLTHTGSFNKELHEYTRYQQILSENGLKTSNTVPELKPNGRSRIRKQFNLKHGEILTGIFPKGGFNPGTKMDIKKWDIENYFELISMLNKTYPEMKIIIFQGKMEFEKIKMPESLNAELHTIANELISACDYFISGDTGSLHIAAAMGVSTLSIFGPSDPRILAPVNTPGSSAKHIYVWKQPACSPCYNTDTAIDRSNKKYWTDHTFLCFTGTHECMKSITAAEAFDEFKRLIEEPETEAITILPKP